MDKSPLNQTRSGPFPEGRTQCHAGLFHFSMAQFLVALIVLLVVYPFVAASKIGDLIENVLMMIILISAVMAVGGRSWVLTILLVIPALAGPWLNQVLPFWVTHCARMVFVAFVVVQLLRFILRSPRVNSEVMCAGVSAYLMIG
ncbi:MAG TPA: hypothetical protein VMR33_04770 [Candidatus Baltobacteraceae bacterium]|jgi:hypothetical protein|nr:hypothetical protein [Candidatus Baltobacteraceae bacterium]